MKGAIAISYIIALILGVLVIGALSYFFFPQVIRSSELLHAQYCVAKCFEYAHSPPEDRTWDPSCNINEC